jgi:hypothetical protein
MGKSGYGFQTRKNPQILGELFVFDYLTNTIKTLKIGLIADIRTLDQVVISYGYRIP